MMPWLGLAGLLLGGLAGAEPTLAPCVYHVDARQGDDSHDGLKPERAWRSLTRVNRACLKPGDRVLFRRGETWRGQLLPQSGTAAGPIVYGAFGEGARPLLLGSASMDQRKDWLPAGPGLWVTVPLWFTPLGIPAGSPGLRWGLHAEGGAACLLKPLAQEQGKMAGYRLECLKPGTRSNQLQLGLGNLAIREGEYLLFTYRARCSTPFTPAHVALIKGGPPWTSYTETATRPREIGTDWSEQTVRFPVCQSAANARLILYLGGVLPPGSMLEFQPRELTRAWSNHAIPLSVDVGNIIFDHGAATGVKKWSEAELRQDGDFLYDAQTWQVKLRMSVHPATQFRSIELALRRHIIDQGGRGYVGYENLDLRYGAAHGIGGGSTHHITVRDCDLSYIGGGHQFTRPDGKPVRFGNGIEFWSGARDCLVEGCRLWDIYDAALTNQGSGTNVQENITYRHNVIWNSEYSFEYWNRDATSRTRNILFEHNTCVNAGQGWGHRQRPDPNGRHLMFYDNTAATEDFHVRGNIFCNATDSCLRLHGRDWTAALKMDHNCWFQARGPLFLWQNEKVGPDRFAAFQQRHGFDRHSVVADPRLVDPVHHDFRLAPDSPARNLRLPDGPTGALP